MERVKGIFVTKDQLKEYALLEAFSPNEAEVYLQSLQDQANDSTDDDLSGNPDDIPEVGGDLINGTERVQEEMMDLGLDDFGSVTDLILGSSGRGDCRNDGNDGVVGNYRDDKGDEDEWLWDGWCSW